MIANLKKMKYLLIAYLVIMNSCSYRIIRTGYNYQEKTKYTSEIKIISEATSLGTEYSKVGEISLKEKGFTKRCSEKDAIELLKKEACSIDANLIIIKNEKRPDIWSTCYRCDADFLVVELESVSDTIKFSNQYSDKMIDQRVKQDQRMKKATLGFSAAAGAFCGVLYYFLFSGMN